MTRLSFRPSALSLGLAVGALALAACSDSPVSPTRSLASSEASFSATPSGNSFIIASDAGTQYCPNQAVLGFFTSLPASQPGITTGCIAARDVQTDGSLQAYNPGWEQLGSGHWIGFTVNGGPSSDYRPTPGKYLYQQAFTLPSGVTSPNLSIDVRADNVVAVYLNGTKLAEEAMHDCNDGAFGPCFWTASGNLHVNANTGFLANPAVNYLSFVVANVPTGYPSLISPYPGGAAPQFGCVFREPQTTGSNLFTGNNAVTTTAGHVGPAPTGPGHPMTPTPTENVANPGQDGCENPTGLAFGGTVSWTPPPTTTWCSPGFWKNHGRDLWAAYYNKLYSTLVGAAPLGKKTPTSGAGSNPTLLQVIDNPSTYGGEATNSVADFLSNKAFGTPIGSGVESCPDNVPTLH